MVSKLLFRVIDPDKRVNKADVFKSVMNDLKVHLIGLKPVTVGFNAIFEKSEDVDVILSDKGIDTLKKLNLVARIPSELRARRSLFLRRIDAYVGAHTANELKTELESQNPWLKVREVYKIKDYTHVFKIECKEVQMADRALREGLLCFYSKVASGQIERETYVSLQLCFRCYRYEAHPTSECPEGSITWCSECGAKDHTFRDCKNPAKQCLNCGGPHRTMTMACKVKKDLMKAKVTKQTEAQEIKKHQTYASVARTAASAAIAQTTTPIQTIRIEDDRGLKAVVSILHAHIHNLIVPGTYKTEVTRLLGKFDIDQPDDLPDNPPSHELFKI